MQKDRQSLYILGTRRKIKVNLEIKEGNTFVEPRSTAPPCHWPPLQLPMPVGKTSSLAFVSLAFENRAPCRCLCPFVIDQREHRGNEMMPDCHTTSLAIEYRANGGRIGQMILVRGQKFEKEFESIMVTVKYF